MGWISMGVGMAVSNARYKKRQREAEARQSTTAGLGAVLVVASAKGAYKGFHKLADAGDALKPVNEQISRELTKTHASTWATLGFFGTAFYHAGTRPVETANPSLYEIGTVLAIAVLGYLVGWLIGKWVGEPDESDSVCEADESDSVCEADESDSVCEAEMLLLAGDDQKQQDTAYTTQTISRPTIRKVDGTVVAEGDIVTYLTTLDGKIVRQITE